MNSAHGWKLLQLSAGNVALSGREFIGNYISLDCCVRRNDGTDSDIGNASFRSRIRPWLWAIVSLFRNQFTVCTSAPVVRDGIKDKSLPPSPLRLLCETFVSIDCIHARVELVSAKWTKSFSLFLVRLIESSPCNESLPTTVDRKLSLSLPTAQSSSESALRRGDRVKLVQRSRWLCVLFMYLLWEESRRKGNARNVSSPLHRAKKLSENNHVRHLVAHPALTAQKLAA